MAGESARDNITMNELASMVGYLVGDDVAL